MSHSDSEDDNDFIDENQKKGWFGRKKPEYNILLLGETGAGKSTTINAFANYLKFNTFKEAKSNDFLELIYSKFTMPDPETGEPFEIRSGEKDENERPGEIGNSSTVKPVPYTFQFKDKILRIIDTPGLGDTEGVSADKENLDQILAHLHYYKQIHGICILVKSSDTRKTTQFRYCITELLAQLHKSAKRNLVFCFTFSRNSFYGPGEGFTVLKGFFEKELKEIKFELTPGKNCFFIDNEAYRFLVAKKQSYPFAEKQEESFKESWIKSVEQSTKMWDHIMDLEPHNLKRTISLNNARKLILELAEPMVRLQSTIQANIQQIQAKEQALKNSSDNREELIKNMNIEVDDLEMEPLPYPRTVCTDGRCTEVINFQGVQKVNYKQHCHEHCYLSNVAVNSIGNPILRNCAAIDRQHANCHQCECSWEKHMHVTTEFIKVKRAIFDTNKEIEITNTDDTLKIIEEAIQKMKGVAQEYQDEYKVIQEISCQFAYLLINHSTTPYNKFLEPYLDLLMEEETKKMSVIEGYSRDEYEALKKMKETHQENVKILTAAIQGNQKAAVRLEDIFKFREQLCQLKHSGPQFEKILNAAKWSKKRNAEEEDKAERRKRLIDLSNVTKPLEAPKSSWYYKFLPQSFNQE